MLLAVAATDDLKYTFARCGCVKISSGIIKYLGIINST